MLHAHSMLRAALMVLALSAQACLGPPVHPAPTRLPLTVPSEIDLTPGDDVRALGLYGVRNARDLGSGLEGAHALIPPDRFFRSAHLAHMTEGDKKTLLEHGVVLDVDLRTVWEAMRSPDPLASDPRFHYEHISLLGVGLRDAMFPSSSLGQLYVHAITQHQAGFREVFHALASAPQGAVLFHCASGKDRTGMIAALLLSLAGVEHAAIVHNYVVSAHYLHPDAQGDDLARAVGGSPPQAIERFLQVLEERYGGARGFLKAIGVSDEDIRALVTRLGQ